MGRAAIAQARKRRIGSRLLDWSAAHPFLFARTPPHNNSYLSRSHFPPYVTADEIMEQLKNVKYPGFSRDIVSFGLVSPPSSTAASRASPSP